MLRYQIGWTMIFFPCSILKFLPISDRHQSWVSDWAICTAPRPLKLSACWLWWWVEWWWVKCRCHISCGVTTTMKFFSYSMSLDWWQSIISQDSSPLSTASSHTRKNEFLLGSKLRQSLWCRWSSGAHSNALASSQWTSLFLRSKRNISHSNTFVSCVSGA